MFPECVIGRLDNYYCYIKSYVVAVNVLMYPEPSVICIVKSRERLS